MEFKKWNNEARLFMIDKSEFYSDPKVYQFGFYDGYHRALKDSKAPEMLEMLKETTEVIKWYMDNSTSELSEPFFNIGANQIVQIEQLIKQATEL